MIVLLIHLVSAHFGKVLWSFRHVPLYAENTQKYYCIWIVGFFPPHVVWSIDTYTV